MPTPTAPTPPAGALPPANAGALPPASGGTPPPEGVAAAPARRGRTKPILFGFAIIVLLVALVAWLHYRNREDTDDAEIAAHIESIAPQVSGNVIEVDVNDNDMVQAGQVLFRLDPRDYQAALQQAQANLDAAEAAANGARTDIPITRTSSGSTLSAAQAAVLEAQAEQRLAERDRDAAEAQLGVAKADEAQAQAQSAEAATNERRYAQLVAKNEVSRQQYDDAVAQAKSLAAAAAAAGAKVTAATQQLASAAAEVQVAADRITQAEATERGASTVPQRLAISRAAAATAQARVEQARAALTQAQLNLDYCTVRAPTAGQVGDKHIDVGDHFQVGQTALDIVPLNDVWVVADFKETQLQDMHPGQRASISVDAFGLTLRGHVDSIGAATGAEFSLMPPENATGNYVKVVQRVPVKIVFDSGQDLSRLRPGLSVEATVFTK